MQVFNDIKNITYFNQETNHIPKNNIQKEVKTKSFNENNNKKFELNEKQERSNLKNENLEEQIDSLINEIESSSFLNNKLKFNVDRDTNVYIVRILNQETEELIAQYPGDTFIKNFKYYKDHENLFLNLKT